MPRFTIRDRAAFRPGGGILSGAAPEWTVAQSLWARGPRLLEPLDRTVLASVFRTTAHASTLRVMGPESRPQDMGTLPAQILPTIASGTPIFFPVHQAHLQSSPALSLACRESNARSAVRFSRPRGCGNC